MGALRDRLRHAFALDPTGAAPPTPEQQAAVDWLCLQIARRHLTTPGLVGLELLRPLNYAIAQVMHFTEPGAWAILPRSAHRHYRHLAAFLERRGSIEYLARRVEHFEEMFERRAHHEREHDADRS